MPSWMGVFNDDRKNSDQKDTTLGLLCVGSNRGVESGVQRADVEQKAVQKRALVGI